MGIFVAIDFETSSRETNAACSVGMVRMEDGLVTGRFSSLIRPPSPVVQYSWVHGLTWPMLKDAPTFPEVWPAMADLMDGADGLVAHNASFDRGVLNGCCQAFGCANPDLPFFCTLKGARACLSLSSLKLDALCNHFGIPLRHHDALSDAWGCARIFLLLLEQGLSLERMKLGPPKQAKAAPVRRGRAPSRPRPLQALV